MSTPKRATPEEAERAEHLARQHGRHLAKLDNPIIEGTTQLSIGGTDMAPYLTAQRGMYGWAKDAANQAAVLNLRMQGLAALTGKPFDVIKDQVSELARAANVSSLAVVSQLEYSYHLGQARQLRESVLTPRKPADRRTVTVMGKAYHYAEEFGQLKLRPGVSPW